MNGIQEVVGSIPSSSTNDYKGLEGFPSKPFFVEYTKEYTNEIGWILRGVRLNFPIHLKNAVKWSNKVNPFLFTTS